MSWEERDEADRIGSLFELLECQFKNYHSFIQLVFKGAKHEDVVLELYASILNNLPIKKTVQNLIDQVIIFFINLGNWLLSFRIDPRNHSPLWPLLALCVLSS